MSSIKWIKPVYIQLGAVFLSCFKVLLAHGRSYFRDQALGDILFLQTLKSLYSIILEIMIKSFFA
jgi:hypothetical protein